MDATYAGTRLAATYERIMALPPERSDNVQRVGRISARLPAGRVLDVGSGLGVFPARMAQAGWQAVANAPGGCREVLIPYRHIGELHRLEFFALSSKVFIVIWDLWSSSSTSRAAMRSSCGLREFSESDRSRRRLAPCSLVAAGCVAL